MLLVCDIGNSNIVFGIYSAEGELLQDWRITSRLNASIDEYRVMMGSLLRENGHAGMVEAAALSSVVPPLTPKISSVIEGLTGHVPLVIGPGVKTGLDIKYEDPREVGADRIVNAVGALTRYEPPLVIVDFGTATTLDVVLPPNQYLGGIILPGLIIALDALVSRTARLRKVDLKVPPEVVGRNTADSIRSGMVNGTAAAIDGLVSRISEEQGIEPTVIGTGGLAQLIKGVSRSIHSIEPDITLLGLYELWKKSQQDS